jgi:S1-C subfamily serine protease
MVAQRKMASCRPLELGVGCTSSTSGGGYDYCVSLSLLLDLLLSLMLLSYIVYGIAIGITKSLLIMAGIIVGVAAAVLVAPVLSAAISVPDIRVIASVAATIVLIGLGHIIGQIFSKALRVDDVNRIVRIADRIAGGFALGLLMSLVLSTNSFSVGKFGSPVLSRTFAESTVIRILHELTPLGVQAQVFRLRDVFAVERNPVFAEDFGVDSVVVPNIVPSSASLSAAAKSVVRITGNAYACGQAQSGTGFVVARNRIVTNAHVVAGVQFPVVEALNGQVLVGTVVYFDASDDLAVIAVAGLDAKPLNKGAIARAGDTTNAVGYPFGGPIVVTASNVQSTKVYSSPNIYRSGASARQIYTLAGQVDSGDSGGPVLNRDGDYVGIVFARATDRANVGYAMTVTQLNPVVSSASALTAAVSSGACIRH